MTADAQLLEALQSGESWRFADWPNPAVPKVAAGVYTIWQGRSFIYVGMSGRAMSLDMETPGEPTKPKGLWTRLNSHAAGRRSGDQFCVYVCDRFVVPCLTADQQARIGDGTLSLDVLTKKFIHDHLSYRFVTVINGHEALSLERDVQRGALVIGKPFLNPL
ncbi:hypothetical protein [Gordonia paraffinivorans]|uniref:hypothetical protein n=1 Tax=Gordonia paraffinivorans TaxID=175628 RepID=UPI001B357765|nr:hypothetical protein [Gordonia paraffinivorans]